MYNYYIIYFVPVFQWYPKYVLFFFFIRRNKITSNKKHKFEFLKQKEQK
tara:strand:- start:124 stop:270 length:147 start_codon:yes stop_codon:yes gene_type:complete